MNTKQLKITRWIIRILALLILIFALPFYFGYGNPLPFTNSEYTVFDNLWLSIFPLVFIGLLAGLKYEKISGYLITVSVLIGFIVSLITVKEFIGIMLVPFIIGVLYLFLGYKK
jgi:hypothetical protein